MMSIDIQKFTADEITLEKLDTLVMRRESFQVVAVSNISSTVEKIEGRIEKADLKCRVFSEYRSGTLLGAFLAPTAPVAWLAGIGMAAHNIATFNPDYEIGKNKVAGTVTVKYMK
jgi:hypothetical protein